MVHESCELTDSAEGSYAGSPPTDWRRISGEPATGERERNWAPGARAARRAGGLSPTLEIVPSGQLLPVQSPRKITRRRWNSSASISPRANRSSSTRIAFVGAPPVCASRGDNRRIAQTAVAIIAAQNSPIMRIISTKPPKPHPHASCHISANTSICTLRGIIVKGSETPITFTEQPNLRAWHPKEQPLGTGRSTLRRTPMSLRRPPESRGNEPVAGRDHRR
jgi:hypothetical protein